MSQTTIFADALSEGIIVNGVARLTFSRIVAEGKVETGGLVVIPLSQIPQMINSLNLLMKQVEDRFKESMAKQEQNSPQSVEAIPSSFSFAQKS